MKFNPQIRVFGDQSYRDKKCPTENAEQITFVSRVRAKYPDNYGAVIIHVKNEGKRTHYAARMDKAAGLTKGAPDIVIPAKRTILIELKRRDHTLSRWQEDQQEYLVAAQSLGAWVCVALGADAAMEALETAINELE